MLYKIAIVKNIQILLIFTLLTIPVTTSLSQVRLPTLISDGMVLQRNSEITIWGWALPGEQIAVTFDGRRRKTTTTSEGEWSLKFPEMKAGGPYTMIISGKNKIVLRDILIGDVWLCAGQSNMVHQMDLHDITYAEDIADAHYPAIRHFKIPAQPNSDGPSKDLKGGSWQRAVSDGVRPFSAVAYFFARKIYEKYRVPIGLINASVGGTPVEAWISKKGLQEFPKILESIKQTRDRDTANIDRLSRSPMNDENGIGREPEDKGLAGPKPWFSVDYIPTDWRRINIPGYWEDQGIKDLNGVVWYRREIDIPQSMVGKAARLFLDRKSVV